MKYMLDTNMCIYMMNKRVPRVLEEIKNHLDDDLYISSITLAELYYGIYRGDKDKIERNKRALDKILELFIVLPFNELSVDTYGRIRADLKAKGQPIGELDFLIASHAKALDITLVTNNVREFERVPGLKIENWA